MYAALGLGLVLVHRASGVVNFAHGAMAMLVTYAFVELRPDLGLWPALAVSVVAAAALGLAVDGLVFRPLRPAPALARVVASVGLLATLQALAVLWFGADSRPVPSLLPNRPVAVLGVDVPRDRLLLAALVVVAAVGLWALYRFTRFGLASRATAEDQTAVAMLGWSPDAVSAANWVLASVLAGLGGILVGPLTALDPATTTLLVVPALAAALAGRLSSFGATVAAALGLGMAQSAMLKLQDDFSWIPRAGVREALPLVVIVVALALGAGRNLGRGAPVERPLPLATRVRRPGRWAAVVVVGAGLGLLLLGGQYRLGLVNSLVGAVICLSLVVLTGYVGQISLAQMAFAGVAGFSLAKLASAWDVPFPVAPLVAAVLAAVVGVAVGLPALRLRGLSLAVVTLAAAVAVEEAVFKAPALTGGFEGTRVPALPGVGRAGTVGFGLVALAVLVAVAPGRGGPAAGSPGTAVPGGAGQRAGGGRLRGRAHRHQAHRLRPVGLRGGPGRGPPRLRPGPAVVRVVRRVRVAVVPGRRLPGRDRVGVGGAGRGAAGAERAGVHRRRRQVPAAGHRAGPDRGGHRPAPGRSWAGRR